MVPPPLKLSSQEPKGYQLVQGEDTPSDTGGPSTPTQPVRYAPRRAFHSVKLKNVLIGIISVLLVLAAINLTFAPAFPPHGHGSDADAEAKGKGKGSPCDCDASPTATVPQYFQTSPELWAGPTATGAPAFLAQTRTFDPTATYVPNAPLQTAVPVEGMGSANESIFQMMGYLSPYTPSPGFGVDEYPLPPGAEIVQLQMLSRHGARYPTSGTGSNVMVFGNKVADAKKRAASSGGGFKGTGALAFLNEWEYQLGYEILVPKGRQELFDSGILHSYMYSSLYNPNSKIIVRTTTQDRMLKSAEYFMAGFFGLEWPNNATIEVIIEEKGFNNSLAGSKGCPNAANDNSGLNATYEWANIYLQKGKTWPSVVNSSSEFLVVLTKPTANARLSSMVQGMDWTIYDTYAAQSMCPYETVSGALLQPWEQSLRIAARGPLRYFDAPSRPLILTWGRCRLPTATVDFVNSSPTRNGLGSATLLVCLDLAQFQHLVRAWGSKSPLTSITAHRPLFLRRQRLAIQDWTRRWYRLPTGSHSPSQKPHPRLLRLTDQHHARLQPGDLPAQPVPLLGLQPRHQHHLHPDRLWPHSVP